jgi:hypothetical protein
MSIRQIYRIIIGNKFFYKLQSLNTRKEGRILKLFIFATVFGPCFRAKKVSISFKFVNSTF